MRKMIEQGTNKKKNRDKKWKGNDVNEDKREREKSWEKLGLSCFWCLVCLFQLLTSLSPGMSTKCLTLLPFIFCLYVAIISLFFLFSLCISFPCHFLSISSSLLSTPCYFILLFSLYISPCLFHMIILLFFIWLPSIVFLSLSLCISHFICILYYLKTQKFKKNNVCTSFWNKKKHLFRKVSNNWKPQNTKW